jgi:hypothetical protein
MMHPDVAGSEHHRWMLAGAVSLVVNGGLLLLVIALTGKRVVHSQQQQIGLTSIEILKAAPLSPSSPLPSPSPSSPLPSPSPSSPLPSPPSRPAREMSAPRLPWPSPAPRMPAALPPGASAGTGARAHVAPVQRSQPSAPAAVQSLADLRIRYEEPTSIADDRATATLDVARGARRSGIGAAVDYRSADGVVRIEIPQPPAVSLARSPRPKHDYSNLRIFGASKFAGETIKLLLTIDARGHVRAVQLLQGVDRALNRKTIALVHTFEYEPALDDAGAAIPGTSRWNFEIVADNDGDLFETAREHSRR